MCRNTRVKGLSKSLRFNSGGEAAVRVQRLSRDSLYRIWAGSWTSPAHTHVPGVAVPVAGWNRSVSCPHAAAPAHHSAKEDRRAQTEHLQHGPLQDQSLGINTGTFCLDVHLMLVCVCFKHKFQYFTGLLKSCRYVSPGSLGSWFHVKLHKRTSRRALKKSQQAKTHHEDDDLDHGELAWR